MTERELYRKLSSEEDIFIDDYLSFNPSLKEIDRMFNLLKKVFSNNQEEVEKQGLLYDNIMSLTSALYAALLNYEYAKRKDIAANNRQFAADLTAIAT